MPFYAKDWRSPGEIWVKTDDGWQKKKILDAQSSAFHFNLNRVCGRDKENHDLLYRDSLFECNGNVQPYCPITLKCTKEVAGFNGLSDALQRLDFRSAVNDQRRFPYTAKLLDLLLSQQRITTLSGCAQKSVLNVLESAVRARAGEHNMHVLNKLLDDLRRSVRSDSWWGQPLGSSQLWGRHVRTIDRIAAIASSIQPSKREEAHDDDRTTFEDLPEECVREILLRLTDHNDVLNAVEAYPAAQKLSAEQRLWRRLCRFHFSPLQIDFIVAEMRKEERKAHDNGNNNYNNNSKNNAGNNGNGTNNGNSNGANGSNKNRCNRTAHPYLNGSGNVNGAGGGAAGIGASNNARRIHVRNAVSNALHEQSLSAQLNDGHLNEREQLTSFQDVREHFDRGVPQQQHQQPINDNMKRNSNRSRSSAQSPADDWQCIYQRLRRQFGLREEYAETLHLCRTCRSLFWKSCGHPCTRDLDGNVPADGWIAVPPQAFLKFFSL